MADATRVCLASTWPDQPWLLDWRVGSCSWPTTPNGTPTRAIYVAALCGRCRPWIVLETRWHRVRRGLAICHEHDDCRRSLAIALACAADTALSGATFPGRF